MVWERFWDTRLDITPGAVDLVVTDHGQWVLHAHFVDRPQHRRALPLLLEALALWQGKRLCVVMFAERAVNPTLGLGQDGDEWPPETEWLEYMHLEWPRGGGSGSEREAP